MKPKKTPFSANFRNGKSTAREIIAALQRQQLDTFHGAAGVSVIRQTGIDDALHQLAQGVNAKTQGRFFALLALRLAAAVSADYVLLSELLENKPRKVSTLGFVALGKIKNNFVYDPTTGPCRQLLERKQICFYVSDVQKQFPRSEYLRKFHVESFVGIPLLDSKRGFIGAIAIMNRQPLRDPTRAVWLLQFAAGRAAAELERIKKEKEMKDSRTGLAVLGRRLVNLQENERREIMQKLHDGISQELALLKLKLQELRAACKTETDQTAYNEASTILHRIAGQAQKLSLSVRPPMLDDLGVQAAVRWCLNRHAERFGFAVRFKCRRWSTRPERQVEEACYRVVQEALNNVGRHAGAKNVWLELNRIGTSLQMSIRDDGVGFDAARLTKLAPRKGTVGLLLIRKRAQVAGGRLRIVSTKGKGTEIRASFANAFH